MSKQVTESPIYQSYLVRFWRDKPCAPWRVSLQSTATEELRHFATLDEYWSYLRRQLVTADSVPLRLTNE